MSLLPHRPEDDIFGKKELLMCPFNPLHVMCESSLQKHIIRCRRTYPNYAQCPFNALHFVRTKDILIKHMEVCPCKPELFDSKIKESETFVHDANLQQVRYWSMEVENWDKD